MSQRLVDADASAWDDVRRQTAAELIKDFGTYVDECVAYIVEVLPELGEDPELEAGLRASAYDNFQLIFEMLTIGKPVEQARAPRGAIEYAEIMVKRGQPLQILLRAYRLGTMYLWRLWRREIVKRLDDPEELMEAVDHSMSFVFDYVDIVAEEVTEEYGVQRERWARSTAALRRETLQQILAGEGVDPERAARRLGYGLRSRHLGLVFWTMPDHESEDVIGRLESGAAQLVEELGLGRPLMVPDGRTTLWVWAPVPASAGDVLEHEPGTSFPAIEGMNCAAGDPAEDIDGFVATHQEALRARRMAELGKRPKGRIVRYSRVAATSLALADPERARRFVLRELGALAEPGDRNNRLRATTRIHLEEGMRLGRTAARLGIHQNTVTYRLRQVEAALERPLDERRYELETALRLFDFVQV